MERVKIYLKYCDILKLLEWFQLYGVEIKVLTENISSAGPKYLGLTAQNLEEHYHFHMVEHDGMSHPTGGGHLWFDFEDPRMAILFKLSWI